MQKINKTQAHNTGTSYCSRLNTSSDHCSNEVAGASQAGSLCWKSLFLYVCINIQFNRYPKNQSHAKPNTFIHLWFLKLMAKISKIIYWFILFMLLDIHPMYLGKQQLICSTDPALHSTHTGNSLTSSANAGIGSTLWHKDNVGSQHGCVWKCCVPHCTQWFCWSLSRF